MEKSELSPEQLQQLLRDRPETVTVIDVRPKDRYDAGHIKGALHIPLKEMEKNVPDLPKEHLIVTYCGGGKSGVAGAKLLSENGYDAVVMQGLRAWEAAGLPVEKSH